MLQMSVTSYPSNIRNWLPMGLGQLISNYLDYINLGIRIQLWRSNKPKTTTFTSPYYTREFVLDEWELHSYVTIPSPYLPWGSVVST